AGLGAGINTSLVEKLHVGAQGPEWEFGFIERILIAGRALWFYAYKSIWPAEIVFIYPRWEIDVTAWWQYLFPVTAILLLGLLFAARKLIGRGPVAGVAVFTAVLAPALGFISYFPMRYSFVADHFQYLAIIVPVTLAVNGLYRITRLRGGQGQYFAMGLCAVILMVMGARTWREQAKYKELQALWEDTVRKNPDCWLALNNLGCVLMSQPGKMDEAHDIFAVLMQTGPDYPETPFNFARTLFHKGDYDRALRYYSTLLKDYPDISQKLLMDIHYDMGMILTERKQFDEAEAHFRKALALKPASPEGFNDLGILMRRAGKLDKAIDAFSEAIAMKPDYAEARYSLAQTLYDSGKEEKAMVHYNFLMHDNKTSPGLLANIHNDLGVIYTRRHQLETAEIHLSKALALQPDSAMFYNNLGLMMVRANRKKEALEAFSKAVALDPDYNKARYQMALLLTEKGDTEAAVLNYNMILARAPADSVDLLVDAHNGLGVIYAEQNRPADAVNHFTNALALKPDFAETHNNLGLALISLGRRQEAIAHFSRALALRPDFTDAASNLAVAYSAAGQYDSALTVLESLLAAAPDSAASISYNIACIHSVRGDLGNAARWMGKALDRGFRLRHLLETDADLENLRKSAYYPGLLERMKKSGGKE
ncbi:MAG: tetratricopeptide repeat protein, partial [Thermodesulfobacteriota bacterium]